MITEQLLLTKWQSLDSEKQYFIKVLMWKVRKY
jgi:hypothetical protein